MKKTTNETKELTALENFPGRLVKSLESNIREIKTVKDVYLSTGTNRNVNIGFLLSQKSGSAIFSKVVSDIVIKIHDFLNPNKSITGEALQFLIEHIEENHKRLTLGDINVWGRNCIKGKYGQAYENLNVQKLIIWLDEYVAERGKEIREIKIAAESERRRRLEKNHNPADPDTALKIIRSGIERTAKKMKEHKPEKKRSPLISYDAFCVLYELDPVEFREEMIQRFDEEKGNIEMDDLMYDHEFNAYLRKYINNQMKRREKSI